MASAESDRALAAAAHYDLVGGHMPDKNRQKVKRRLTTRQILKREESRLTREVEKVIRSDRAAGQGPRPVVNV
jgi:hypothetical protein